MPYTLGLLASIPRMDRERTDRLDPIPRQPAVADQASRPAASSIPAASTPSWCRTTRCVEVRPELLESEPDHLVRCHLPPETRQRIAARGASARPAAAPSLGGTVRRRQPLTTVPVTGQPEPQILRSPTCRSTSRSTARPRVLPASRRPGQGGRWHQPRPERRRDARPGRRERLRQVHRRPHDPPAAEPDRRARSRSTARTSRPCRRSSWCRCGARPRSSSRTRTTR